jgi:hypothetical protein
MTVMIPFWFTVSFGVMLYLLTGGIVWNYVSQMASGCRGLIRNPGKKWSPFIWILAYPMCFVLIFFLKAPEYTD